MIPPGVPLGGGLGLRAHNEINTASPAATGSSIGIESCTDQSRGPGLATSIDQQAAGPPSSAARGPNDPVARPPSALKIPFARASAATTGWPPSGGGAAAAAMVASSHANRWQAIRSRGRAMHWISG